MQTSTFPAQDYPVKKHAKPALHTLGSGLFGLFIIGGSALVLASYSRWMDAYEIGILLLSALALCVMGMRWRALQKLSAATAVLSLTAVWLYGGDLSRAGQSFFLKYFLASQSAIMWMGLLFWCATVVYFVGWLARSEKILERGSRLVWAGVLFGFVGMFTRWAESYLLGPDLGHIPVSNLYEVFVLFSLITALLYLHLEARLGSRQLGGFVMLVVSAAVGFLFWYGAIAGAHQIQPLIPALQSYWMKLHVPTNFIGYGAFSMAAMLGIAWLAAGRPYFSVRLPSRPWLEEVMYKSIALGFVFFTVATILGALWAAEAWGGYWSWDPKETWALIVWLNYAAWLHCRLVKNMQGKVLAWWAVVGFFVTLFAFLGVNMFLAGLHSYGAL